MWADVIDVFIRLWTAVLLPGDPPRFSFVRLFGIGIVALMIAWLLR